MESGVQIETGSLLRAAITALLLIPVGLWARQTGVGPGSVPLLSAGGRGFWLLGILVSLATVGLYARGGDGARASGSGRTGQGDGSTWLFPLVVSLTGVLLLQVYHSLPAVALVSGAAFMTLAVSPPLRRRHATADPGGRLAIYTLLVHLVAFFALAMVYINKLRSLYSASAVFVLATLLLLALIDREPAPFVRRLVYALCGGIVLGQITWVLNYWRATGWTGGAALLIFFYFMAGLILSHLRAAVTRRVVAEFGVVSGATLAILAAALLR